VKPLLLGVVQQDSCSFPYHSSRIGLSHCIALKSKLFSSLLQLSIIVSFYVSYFSFFNLGGFLFSSNLGILNPDTVSVNFILNRVIELLLLNRMPIKYK